MRRHVLALVLCVVAAGAVSATASSAPISPTQPSPTSPTSVLPPMPLPPKQPDDKCSATGPLEVYLPFTGNAKDASGKCRNGAALGPVLTKDKDSVDARAYDFDNDAVINVGGTSSLAFNKLTVAAWVKLREAPKVPSPFPASNSFCGQETIVSKADAKNSGNFVLGVELCRQDNKLRFAYSHVFDRDGKMWSTGVSDHIGLTKDQWTHVAATYDGTNMRIYVNGKIAGTQPAGVPRTSVAPIRIGRGEATTRSDSATQGFKGAIDEVRVYSTALSEAEIGALMGTRTSSVLPSPIARPEVK
jgi:hypothetical protein